MSKRYPVPQRRAESQVTKVPEEGLGEPRLAQDGDNVKRILTSYSKPDLIYTRYPRGR